MNRISHLKLPAKSPAKSLAKSPVKSFARALAVMLPISAAVQLATSAPSLAQDMQTRDLKGFWLTTPYPELALRPGEKENIQLTLKNADMPPQRAELDVSGIPDGWDWALEGGGREVTAAIVQPNGSERLMLKVTPPASSADKSFPIKVTAHYGNAVATLPMTLKVSSTAAGGVKLTPQLPALRGTAKSTFTYKLKVANNGAEDALFNLAAQVPDGFQTRFKQGYGSEEITGLPVKAGATSDLTVEVVPPHAVEAGRYPIKVAVADGENVANTDLSLEVTGQPEIRMEGPQGRLSGSAVAGKDTDFNFTVTNTGSAPVSNIALRASMPQGWKVSYEPKAIPMLAPDARQEVSVSIHPSEKAIAGDYMLNLTASSGAASDTEKFRVTVETSTIWGLAGLGVIAASVIVLGVSVTRYGRR